MSAPNGQYDVVIVGAGVSGALLALQLGRAGKRVLLLEAGPGLPTDNNEYMQRFYLSTAKVPESPYPPEVFTPPGGDTLTDPRTLNAGRPTTMMLDAGTWQNPATAYMDQQGPLPFSSTYERLAGGTMRHWLGTSLRFVPNDFRMKTAYGRFTDWPLGYDDLSPWYDAAEQAIGVSAEVSAQSYLGIRFNAGYQYPMAPIPPSLVDQAVDAGVSGKQVDGLPLVVSATPAGRNSQPYQGRRVCAGNTNCIPICPIQAKYDPSVSLAAALALADPEGKPYVQLLSQTVANQVVLGEDGQVARIDYIQYADPLGGETGRGSVSATRYVLATNAIETPRLCLMSTQGGRLKQGVANSSGQMGRNLMDHPLYLAWALAPEPVFGFRGPLSTSGIESLRDGAFRSERGAFRIEIGNEGWNFSIGDPWTTTVDMVNGSNLSQLNPPTTPGGASPALWGPALLKALNDGLSRQFRLGFLVEQSPDQDNTVTLSDQVDHLGLPRPRIHYDLSDYTRRGMVAARQAADAIFEMMGATQYTTVPADDDPAAFDVEIDGKPERLKFFGSGHIVGTCRMGSSAADSVVDADQRCWDHRNLFIVGSATFPTVATANPTLTLAALALRTAKVLVDDLA